MTKILIGVVTCAYKDYCWKEFRSQLLRFEHDILIVDNSLQIKNRPPFNTIHYPKTKDVMTAQKQMGGNGLTIITRDCMNILRDKFLEGDYTHLMILESDVFITDDAIDRLLDMDCDVANFTYAMRLQRYEGKLSVCVQSTNEDNVARMIDPEESKGLLKTGIKTLNADKLNGKKLTHCGYGCTLVRRKVLEKINFKAVRTPDGIFPFPDSMFHYDVNTEGFSNKLDTDYLPFHCNLNDETKIYREIVDIQTSTNRAQRRKRKPQLDKLRIQLRNKLLYLKNDKVEV